MPGFNFRKNIVFIGAALGFGLLINIGVFLFMEWSRSWQRTGGDSQPATDVVTTRPWSKVELNCGLFLYNLAKDTRDRARAELEQQIGETITPEWCRRVFPQL